MREPAETLRAHPTFLDKTFGANQALTWVTLCV
jgi:hypothetical protein